MAITASDILIKFSVKAGSAGNSTSGTAGGSLGKYISTTQVTDNTLNNVFDNISGQENAASTVDYRCLFIHNSHATLAGTSTVVYLSAEVSGGASISIGLDPTGATLIGSSSAQAVEITNETTAPAGVTFSAPTTYGAGLSIGSLSAGYAYPIWIRRTAANTSAKDNDGVTLTVSLDTSE